MYVSKDVYVPLLRAKKYVGVFILVLFTFIIMGRERKQGGGKTKGGGEKRFSPEPGPSIFLSLFGSSIQN